MIKRILDKFQELSKNVNMSYLSYSELPVDDKLVLLEGGQGSNINGNMFSILKEISTNPRFKDYKCVFVVTQKTIEKAKKRIFDVYGFENVELAIRNSNIYCKYLATAKYIATDNSFPPYFLKRAEQVFLNTWHGTPLKTLGKSDKSNLGSLANIQKNYLMCDYALFPNEFTYNVFMEDYYLKDIFCGKTLIANYPRNYVFYDKKQGEEMKNALGYEGKKVFAYMPTWRGMGRKADTKNQIRSTIKILREFDERLDDDTVLLVNLHFLLSSNINCSEFKHIAYFPEQYDTYEVLNACDGLVTDYSSVFFDYAVTGKKIILYAYDKEKYLSSRGTYMPFEDLPFPITESVEDTIAEMKEPAEDYSGFVEEYCPNGSEEQCADIFNLMLSGETDKFEVKKHNAADNLSLIYAGALNPVYYDSIRNYIEENPQYKHIVVYAKTFDSAKKEFVNSLDEKAGFMGLLTAYQYNKKEVLSIALHGLLNKAKPSEELDNFFEKEAKRRFYSLNPVKVVDFTSGNYIEAGILSKISGKKYNVRHGDFFLKSKLSRYLEKFTKKLEKNYGFSEIDNFEKENELYIEHSAENVYANDTYRRLSKFKNVIPFYMASSKKLKCVSFFSYKTPVPIAMADTFLCIDDKEIDFKIIGNRKRKSKRHWGIISFEIPVEEVVDLPSNCKVMICYKNRFDKIVQCHAYYFAPLGSMFFGLRSAMLHDKKTDTVAIFRQSVRNNLNVYVRSFNTTDKLVERLKQVIAFGFSVLWRSSKAKKIVLLYEKNSSKYEESASVTFENLIDNGYKNAYFIIDRDYQYIDRIAEKYKSNIIYKYTFKHYLYFFKAKTFIGTEALVHAIDLKTFNILALKKISDKNLNYVFLQHGVMYMVSLNSESRSMFKRKELKGKYRVIVSSVAEANHFVELGGHFDEDLYITGLPKFDRNVLSPDADKIAIMPTWRPWEINAARDDFTETAYYKMVMKIYDSVPDDLKEKVIVLPHPLIANELRELNSPISDKLAMDARYDDILQQTRILITDYSSIAYDAFYRGARVIFYWEEKDFCMSQYGPSTKLMLNEENVYGDYFYNTVGLPEAIRDNYDHPQKEEYVEKYSHIVQFRDGRNTERLIEFLKEDKLI